VHRGGILYDLAGHMLDQIVWLLGRPDRVTSFLRSDDDRVPGFIDNTVAVFEFDATADGGAIGLVDIAAMEARPMARRFEVYGTLGSAILLEPFEPASRIRLCLERARDGYQEGEQYVAITPQSRQALYERELDAFLETVAGRQPLDRSLDHELLVQETLLRATGALSDA
jgi:predicted dehydrogenase